ncbi:unnamed protein product [Cuscuta europaea]|uniref:Uncharacterized protein n=1 Tax=Cuscuta europaea TaxID=41803 RepID=A0A9P0ZK02_CUSEU|nr:unnamed protein product [Cuscuta europaea]
MTTRSTSYTIAEDALSCQVYLDITQDSTIGKYQTANDFWSRIEAKYNEHREQNYERRNIRSFHSRMDIISTQAQRLNGCVKQVENLNPSGASEKDIVCNAIRGESLHHWTHWTHICHIRRLYNGHRFTFSYIDPGVNRAADYLPTIRSR